MAAARWLRFFKDAGIPNGPASEYAVIFSDNRMRMDMLNEISKEILLDLGIKAMGDVISILRHSKKVYAELSRSAEEEFDLEVKTPAQRKRTTGGLYSNLISKPPSPPTAEKPDLEKKKLQPLKSLPKRPQEKPKINAAGSSSTVIKTSTRSLSERFADYNPSPVKKKKIDPDEVITISIPSVPEKKAKKVENKEKRPKEPEPSSSQKKTVFDRLGSEPEHKTLSKEAPRKKPITPTPSQKISRTTVANPASLSKTAESTSNVFKRLGGTPSTASESSGLSGRFSKTSTTAGNPSTKKPIESTFTVTLGGAKNFINLNKSADHNVTRPIKSVKPIPRRPLTMDSVPTGKATTSKQTFSKPDNISKSRMTGKAETQKKASSVFDRLGK